MPVMPAPMTAILRGADVAVSNGIIFLFCIISLLTTTRVSAQLTKRLAWISQLEAVRDTQDRATIARNRRIDMIRKQRRPEPEDLPWGPQEERSADDTVALQQETEILGRALSDLPVKQRQLIERAYFGELTHAEIASETGLPLGTIKSRLRLALDRLRHAMN